MPTTQDETSSNKPAYSSQYGQSYPSLPVHTNTGSNSSSSFAQPTHPARARNEARATPHSTSNAKFPSGPARTVNDESSFMMGMNSPYSESSSRAAATRTQSYNHSLPSSQMENRPSGYSFPMSSTTGDQHAAAGQLGTRGGDIDPNMNSNNGAMMIESHDVDMNALQQQESFPFSNGEILPWLEYLPQDVLSFFGEQPNFGLMSPDNETTRPPP